MRILAFGSEHSGCMWHRIAMPLEFMGGISAYLTNIPTEQVMGQHWDMMLFNRMCYFDSDWELFRNTPQTRHMKIVMDLDDWWVLPPSHINYPNYKKLQPRIENNLRNADLVTVTHERLAEKCLPFNSNVVVIPNAIPYGFGQYTDVKIPCEPCRFFWAGGVSHVQDVELLRNPMKRIKDLKNIETVIGGYDTTNQVSKQSWDRMVSAFTCSLKIPGKVLASLPLNEYMNHWSHADVLLLPLENTEWHGMKSNLKLLEAASKKIPVVCSKTLPYTEGDPPVLWVEKQSDWYKHAKALSESKDLRSEMATKLWEWSQQFNLITVNLKRKECYLNLLGRSNSTSTSGSSTKEAVS